MRLIIALRLFNKTHARMGIEHINKNGVQYGRLVDLDVDRLYPALKNGISFLIKEGKLPPVREGQVLRRENDQTVEAHTTQCSLYWCEVESSMPLSFWRTCREVEVVLPKPDLEAFSASIRSRVGGDYIDACERFAEGLELKLNSIAYVPPHSTKVAAA